MGGSNVAIVNTVDEELIENIQFNRTKANEFHEGGKFLDLIFNHQNTSTEKNSAIKK